jgi:hypothetical protein
LKYAPIWGKTLYESAAEARRAIGFRGWGSQTRTAGRHQLLCTRRRRDARGDTRGAQNVRVKIHVGRAPATGDLELRGVMDEPLLLSSSVEVAQAPLPPALASPASTAAPTPRSNAARRRLHAAVLGVQFSRALSTVPSRRSARPLVGPSAQRAADAAAAASADSTSAGAAATLMRVRTTSSIERQHNAAAHVEDAFLGEVDDEFKRPWLQMFYSRLTWLVRLVMLTYICLSFVERPSWCYSMPCEGPGGEALPLSGLPYLPREVSGGIEIACLFVFALEVKQNPFSSSSRSI